MVVAKDSMIIVEIYNQNSTDDLSNSMVENFKNTLIEKMDNIGLYSERKEKILNMVDFYLFNQLFSRSLISEDMHISNDKAAELLRILKKIDVIEPIKGQGKGKYKFKF